MRIVSVAEAKAQFSSFVHSSAQRPVVVTRNGKPVAMLIGVEDEDEIERLLMAYSPRLRAILDDSRKQIAAGTGVSHDEFWKRADALPPKRRKATRRKLTKSKAPT